MTKQEFDEISAHPTTVITAPAGHGKTEMIVDMVEHFDGKQLLLTHTHAGVDSLQKRLNTRKIPKSKYTVLTIAAFCTRWCMSYRNTAAIDTSLSPYKTKSETNRYYAQFYTGAKQLFRHDWLGRVLQSSYSGIIVDEYQDCLQVHHELFQEMSRYLPIRVLGDPLQGIFSFGRQQLVNWDGLCYHKVEVETSPWRWANTNPALGQYMVDVRNALWPTLSGAQCTLNVGSCFGSVSLIHPRRFNLYSILDELKDYRSVLYITKWEPQQRIFCKSYPGIFQVDEKQECDDLYKYAEAFSNLDGSELYLSVLDFESNCKTNINAELGSYKERLGKNSFDFGRIKRHKEFGELLLGIQNCDKYEAALQILGWIEKAPVFKFYRRELHNEMIRSLKYAKEHDTSVLEAAQRIRKDPALQKRYRDFKFLSSRTLLSKGLEFDCVIIDMADPLSAKEFYVAMTRAMRKIYIISPSSTLELSP